MKLINNYLNETGRHLADECREDIISELRVSLEEQVNDLADAENRQSSVEDEKVVLLQMGHPVKLAASYKPAQYLIGPALFPAYVYSMKIGIVASLSVQLAIGLLLSAGLNWDLSIGSVFGRLFDTAVMVVTLFTLIFAALEYSSEKLNWYDDWNPDLLPSESTHSADKGDMVTNMVVEGFMLLWLNDVVRFVSDNDGFPVALSNNWAEIFWPLNIILGISFLIHAYLLLREQWTRSLLRIELGLGVSSLAVCCYLFLKRPLVVIAETESVSDWLWVENLGIGIIAFIALVWLWDIFKYGKILRGMS